jgi:RNA polymerase sigma factor (sigma-70 family)
MPGRAASVTRDFPRDVRGFGDGMDVSVERAVDGVAGFGDEARFAQLYTRCHRAVREYCSRRIAADAVDDAVAETFLTVWRRLDEVPAEEEAALVWTYGVAYRVIGHQLRSKARRGRLHDRLLSVECRPVATTEEFAVDGDEHRLVLDALARLNHTDTEVLQLVEWAQLSTTDVAAALRIEPDAARQRLHRARRHLAREYGRLRSRIAADGLCVGVYLMALDCGSWVMS